MHGAFIRLCTLLLRKPFSDCIKKKRRINERVQYVGRQLLSEFGPWQWRSLEFWSTIVILILCWWIRLYLHYVAQYSFLRAIRIPVNRWVPKLIVTECVRSTC